MSTRTDAILAAMAKRRRKLARWRDTPAILAERQTVLVRDAWGRTSQPPRLFATAFVDMQPMIFPEPQPDATHANAPNLE